ncbi:unnamed protein product [Miscanthus lutarioriparius]|uniref:Uncharacterized protein n=1 Tax=Miscanthus lutarioriparius TaxID=422564 RepID=A0A811NKY6_9POAL|nr:unnamed protein product [Miscanthus lutarioriparius]
MATYAAGTGGKRSGSSSAIFAATTSGYHILRIHGYAGTKETPNGEYIKSHPFTIGGHCWTIRYYPNGYGSKSSDHISFFLELGESVAKAVKAQYQIRFVDQEEKKPLTSEPVTRFENQTTSGNAYFTKRQEFEKSEHLKDGSFAVRCDIVVIGDVRVEATASGSVAVPASDLHQHLGDLLRDEKGADVAFDVGGRTFSAHRCVLAARSPVFRAELFGAMKESDAAAGVVRVDDMEVRAFSGLLHFVYTDMFPETSKEEEGEEEEEDVMAQHLLVAADRYGMERLKLMCEDKLCKYIDVGTVAAILTLAEQHHCHGLKKACFEFLSSAANLRAAAASDGFKHLTSSCPSIMEEFVIMLGNLVL